MRKVQMVTDRELEILKILWARGKASVREVQEDLNKSAGPVAYSTVQTLLRTLEEKGSIKHEVDGRTFVFVPLVQEDKYKRNATRDLLDRVFGGDVREFVHPLVADARGAAPRVSAWRVRQRLVREPRGRLTPA